MKNKKYGIEAQGRRIGHDEPLFVIAEAGVNHNGSLEMALKLVDVAAEAGADAVKFQTFFAENIITRKAPKAQYHVDTTGSDVEQTWFQLLKTQELSFEYHKEIIKRCIEKKIMFMSTPYDLPSIDMLDSLGISIFKVASSDSNNIPFLRYLASKGRPIILSTAMCTMEEVIDSVKVIRDCGVENLVVLQCTGSYPAPADEANLHAMLNMKNILDVAVGYSDHVPGNVAGIAAVALGACVYEKHFTLSRDLPGPDHRSSLEPEELKDLIVMLRKTQSTLGSGYKHVMPCEVANRERLRKRVVASCAIPVGTRITSEMLTTKRTGGVGEAPAMLDKLVGKITLRDLNMDDPLLVSDLTEC